MINRAVDGLMSTGLKEETYDVVITAGGFAQDAINPLDITEMLRLLRPEGILLWTMRTVSEEGTTEFGLLDANLRSLEKSGRCKVLKHNTFADPETKAVGVFYMVRRLAGSLPDYLPDFVPKGLKEQISSIMTDNSEPANRVKFYDDWSLLATTLDTSSNLVFHWKIHKSINSPQVC